MKKIPLTRGFEALVDNEDFDWLSQYKWCGHFGYWNIYAKTCDKGKFLLMHRMIINAKPEEYVDHKDGNGLNNMRQNLRLANNSQNQANRKRDQLNTSGFKGVNYCFKRQFLNKPWMAKICVNYTQKYLGYFETPKEAAAAYDQAAIKYFGEFARTNAQIEEENRRTT